MPLRHRTRLKPSSKPLGFWIGTVASRLTPRRFQRVMQLALARHQRFDALGLLEVLQLAVEQHPLRGEALDVVLCVVAHFLQLADRVAKVVERGLGIGSHGNFLPWDKSTSGYSREAGCQRNGLNALFS